MKSLSRNLTFFLLLLVCASSAVAAALPKRCSESICFINEAAKKQFERDNACIVQNKCTYSVDSVKETLKTIPRSSPTYGFFRNQACIAGKSCTNKSVLNSSGWLDNVVYDFITPLVNEAGDWKAKKAECEALMILADLRCQQLMAEYHISQDLQTSVNKNGCGTQKDWDQIGTWLEECIAAGIKDDNIINPFDIAATYAAYKIGVERKKVRDACIADRTSRGLKIEE